MSSTKIGRRGLLLVLSSPSGAGKTSITRLLVERDPMLHASISATTRPPRAGEVHGQHYHFVDAATFEAQVKKGEFLEHATVFGYRYGTLKGPVVAELRAGRDVISDIDWQGTQQLKESVRQDLVPVFILPPSMAALEDRLRRRAQDSAAVVSERMAKSSDEMSHWPEYEYVIVNTDLETSVREVQAILTAERLRRERQVGLAEFVNRLREGR